MNYIVDFIINSASYFIMAYFVYSILGRNRKISIIGLSILLAVELFNFIGGILLNVDIKIMILYFVATVLPVLVALYGFLRITGGLPSLRVKFKGKKLKGISSDIQPKYLSLIFSYVSVVGSLTFGILAYFYIEDYMKYVIIGVLTLSFIFGIYMVFTNAKIESEKVILIIGRNKEKIYSYDIPKNKHKIVITDFFNNPNYIVDPIGVASLRQEDKKIEKHYLYWIATGDQIDVKGTDLKEITLLSYKDDLDHFEKYHFRSLTFQVGRMGKAELLTNKRIK